jgi:hypothetical protein
MGALTTAAFALKEGIQCHESEKIKNAPASIA